jgi:hypothetical protein
MNSSTPIFAAFVWPALFYAGAAAVSVPILIHLLARRRFKRIRWAAIEFLIDAEKRNRRRVRIEELILLALRCAAVLLVGLLIARPFFAPRGLAAILGGPEHTERIIVLDDSFSMGYSATADLRRGGEGSETNFERAKHAVRGIIESIRRRSGSDTVTLLRSSDIQTPVVASFYLTTEQVEQLYSRLEGLAPSERGLDVDGVFQAVRSLLDRLSGTVSATVYVVSDFQRINWVDRNARSAAAGEHASSTPVLAPLVEWAGKQRALKLALVDVGQPSAANLAVTDLGITQNQLVAGNTGTVRATVCNYSDSAVHSVELQVGVGTTPQTVREVKEVAPGQPTAVPVDVVFGRAGPETIRAEIGTDALPIDNRRYLSAHVNTAIKLLLVNGESSGMDVAEDEVALLRTALRPAGAVFSGNEVQTIDDIELENTPLTPYHAVFLCNVYRVSEQAADALQRYAAAGGGVVIFLGDQIADAALYNDILYRDGKGLLPARLGEMLQAPAGGVTLSDADLAHPAVRVFSGADNPFLKRIAFYQYFGCTPASAAEGAEEAEPPAANDLNSTTDASQPRGAGHSSKRAEQRPAHVIARFSDAEHTPAIIERPCGLGRVVLITTSADQEWNDWPKDPSYVVAMLELAQYVAKRGDESASLTVGAPIEMTLDPSEYQPDVTVRTPAYPAEAELTATAAPSEEGPGLRLRWDRTDQSGIYQLVLRRRDGGEDLRLVAVNLDPLESDLTHADEGELHRAMPELPFVYVSGSQSEAAAGDDVRRELWPAVLIGLVALLMCEQGLAWFFGRRNS